MQTMQMDQEELVKWSKNDNRAESGPQLHRKMTLKRRSLNLESFFN